MPKLKTKSGAKKRFSRTASGKIKMNVAHKRHRLISKPKSMKRKARGTVTLQPGDAKLALTYMPYLRGGARPGHNRGPRPPPRHKKVLDLAKGYRGRSSKAYRIALEKVEK